MHFTLDVLKELRIWSLTLQRRASVLIGMEQFRADMISTITALKTVNGAFMQEYLQSVTCSDTIRGSCTLAQYISSVSVRWHGMELNQDTRFPEFNGVRNNLIDTLVEHLEQYFPEGSLRDFDVLNPKNWPMEPGHLPHSLWSCGN